MRNCFHLVWQWRVFRLFLTISCYWGHFIYLYINVNWHWILMTVKGLLIHFEKEAPLYILRFLPSLQSGCPGYLFAARCLQCPKLHFLWPWHKTVAQGQHKKISASLLWNSSDCVWCWTWSERRLLDGDGKEGLPSSQGSITGGWPNGCRGFIKAEQRVAFA